MVYQTKCSEKDYHFLHNNCHHFAKEMFEMASHDINSDGLNWDIESISDWDINDIILDANGWS